MNAVRLFVTDVDGVLTSGQTFFGPSGPLGKWFSVRDGHACEMLRARGVAHEWLTREESEITAARARWLRVTVHAGVQDKRDFLAKRAAELGLTAEQVAYMGDDVFDVGAMRWAGWSVAPADAHDAARAAATFVTTRRGGDGAFREAVETLIGRGLL
jgi:YrbI family 3-deoxy-D-manno-octulosonate 8-phosphate phosphatase